MTDKHATGDESADQKSEKRVYKMLYKMSLSVSEIPPLFVQLDDLQKNESGECISWKEKARWIRFEEQAEDVLGRWSKPHVATLPQTSLDELNELLKGGLMLFDNLLHDMKEIADTIANELHLIGYFDLTQARYFAEILLLPHHHHHEKKVKKTMSGTNLNKLVGSNNLTTTDLKKDGDHSITDNTQHSKSLAQLKYQYSFTDSIMLEDFSSIADFKENTKFKKKVHRKAEGASILVMPVDFVDDPKLIFLRLEAATELPGLLEVRLRSRFLVVLIGPRDRHIQLYEVGRAISTCLADDVCREMFYSAKSKEEVISIINIFNRSTMVIPPGEWNPKIRIEPPEKFLSKEERKKVPELSEYIHDDEMKDHSDHADPTLKGSRRPFAGIVNDIKRKLPFYVSDFTDCLNLQCIATTLYMYLVSLCSLVAFGGMLGEKTEYMGTMECILAGSVCGVLFSLFSGQPLNIISATGPMLILESIIKNLCDKNGIEFMEFRLWIGLWTAFLLLILVLFNLSFLVKFITRFTEDCFATLVAIIFIIDAIKSTIRLKNLSKYIIIIPENGTNSSVNDAFFTTTPIPTTTTSFVNSSINSTLIEHHGANKTYIYVSASEYKLLEANNQGYFFFSVLLFLLTFFICMGLKSFRNMPYLPSKIRQILSDFAVLISILIASGIDAAVGLQTQKLTVPSEFKPTVNRSWIVPLFGKNEWYTIFLAIVPAIIATILVFMDQQITAVIVNRKEFKLKKSSGYHLDLFIVAASIAMCSFLGLPWFVAATVLALTHVNSLRVMSENTAPGEKPKFMGVREQRVTTLLMSILVGLSVFLTSVLTLIPMSVLYGVFLFMGVSALNGMQLFDRLLIIFMPAKYQPDYPYLRHVSTKRVHLFTLIQVVSTSCLYIIKLIDAVAITFPILVLATCGIRKLLDFVFTQHELLWLDDLLPGRRRDKHFAASKMERDNLLQIKQGHAKKAGNARHIYSDSATNSNSYLEDDQHDSSIYGNYVMNQQTDENNNNHRSASHEKQPVKFVTHFSNIKEDEDKN